MQTTWLLVVLAAGVQGSWNSSTLEEVVVNSQPLTVIAAEPDIGVKAAVRPLPRVLKRSLKEGTSPNNFTSQSITEQTSDTERHIATSKKETTKEEGRGHMKKMKKAFKKIMPYLMVPGMMALGYAPFILASLKMFVMNAVMINMMAFNAAIFITLRNMVFGPRVGQHVKYYNFGYSHRKKPHDYP